MALHLIEPGALRLHAGTDRLPLSGGRRGTGLGAGGGWAIHVAPVL